jgi:hypothetical protein
MRALITDEMVRTIGIVGSPEECVAEIENRFGAMASEICCYFAGYDAAGADLAALIDGLHQPA